MNKYVEIFFWILTMYMSYKSILHISNTLKSKESTDRDIFNAVVYVAGSITMALLLIYKPFDTQMTSSHHRKKSPTMGAVFVSTSMDTSTSVGTTV
jgi:hypothetical protein